MVGIMTLPPEVEIVKERSSRIVKDVDMFAFALELSDGRKWWDGGERSKKARMVDGVSTERIDN